MKRIIALLLAIVMCFALAACGSDKSDETLKATIVTNDGETVSMSAAELMEVYDSNEARFYKLYGDAKITFVGTVSSIKTNTSVIVEDGSVKAGQNKIVFDEGWCLVIGEENASYDLADFYSGQTLKVTTSIFGAPFDTDFIKEVCDNNRVVWLVGNDIMDYEQYSTIETIITVIE